MNRHLYLSIITTFLPIVHWAQSPHATLNQSVENDTTSINRNALEETIVTAQRINKSVVGITQSFNETQLSKSGSVNLMESLNFLNGVQAQVNCSVCNTSEIQINGLEGAYTTVLIDGMPIVSALGSVYGLTGIPNSLIDRVEVSKGPADAKMGMESMGGTINIITKNFNNSPKVLLATNITNLGEYNIDVATKFGNKKYNNLLSINYFNNNRVMDVNSDGFTDFALTDRIALFNKWNLNRKEGRIFSNGIRVLHENRWGGDLDWNRNDKGSDIIYGESIITNRVEWIGKYELPIKEEVILDYSFNAHAQNSYYGDVHYKANQSIGFVQLYWNKPINPKLNMNLGTSHRYVMYDDNTTATYNNTENINQMDKTYLPGLFAHWNWKVNRSHQLNVGGRVDYMNHHGVMWNPRLGYQWKISPFTNLKFSAGSGTRVMNVFTEDHASLTNARTVIIGALQPEKATNYVFGITHDIYNSSFGALKLEGNVFYNRFKDKIVPDYDTDPNKIIYENNPEIGIAQGASININYAALKHWNINMGVTYLDVFNEMNGEKISQYFKPKWSGNFQIAYLPNAKWQFDVTAKFMGRMKLPILPNDFRAGYSPNYSLVNFKVDRCISEKFDIGIGVKNLMNFMPKNPIMRPFDPFDKLVDDPINNPFGYTFDTSYNYAPMKGRHFFLTLKWNLQ